uniref:Uncharacterized protein n=1 Tax=Wuchereria bancrofti TaxID=6293 RepID=A0AAF5Q5R0_WUCBA
MYNSHLQSQVLSRTDERYAKKRVKLGFENVVGGAELVGEIYVTAGAAAVVAGTLLGSVGEVIVIPALGPLFYK